MPLHLSREWLPAPLCWNFLRFVLLYPAKRILSRQGARHRSAVPLRLSKKSKDFSDSLKNAVTFPPLRGGKVLAALAERLAKQGIQGI